VLLHLVDGTSATPAEDYRVVLRELDAYGAGLAGKPRVIGLNKVDALAPEEAAERAAALGRAVGAPVHRLSGATGQGVPGVLRALKAAIAEARSAGAPARREAPWHP
jgi:GTP-binding protein